MSGKILRHQDLIVYQKAIEAAMNIFAKIVEMRLLDLRQAEWLG